MKDAENRETYAPVWDEIRAHLEGRRRAVMHEIRAYPQPIAGCDAQIPALWEARDAISAELARLDSALRETTPEHFLATSPVIDEADRDRLRKLAAAPVEAAAEQADAHPLTVPPDPRILPLC